MEVAEVLNGLRETVNPLKFSKTLLKQGRNLIENANVSQEKAYQFKLT